MTVSPSRWSMCLALALALLVPAATVSAQLQRRGPGGGRASNRTSRASRALPPGNPPPPVTGAAGPPPLGAAGPAPVGAAGPAPVGAAGPPPLGAAGPPPVGAGGVQPRFPELEPPRSGAGTGCVGEECAALPPDALSGGMLEGQGGMDDGIPVE